MFGQKGVRTTGLSGWAARCRNPSPRGLWIRLLLSFGFEVLQRALHLELRLCLQSNACHPNYVWTDYFFPACWLWKWNLSFFAVQMKTSTLSGLPTPARCVGSDGVSESCNIWRRSPLSFIFFLTRSCGCVLLLYAFICHDGGTSLLALLSASLYPPLKCRVPFVVSFIQPWAWLLFPSTQTQ